MKRTLIAIAAVCLTAPDAEACVAGRARARTRAVSRTVTTHCQQAPPVTVMVPQTRTVMVPETKMVPKTILVPETKMVPKTEITMVPVIQAAPPVVSTSRTTERVRGREVVRGVVGAPVRVVGRVLEALPCPNCR